ncbi:MAG: electron transfer flavoprotein subunit alpha/FixB family protein [Phycisphaerae bacterium]
MKTAEHSGIWILAEQHDGAVQRISFELLTRARQLADKRDAPLTAVIFGHQVEEEGLQALIRCGADRVIAVEATELSHFLLEPYARCFRKLIEEDKPEIIIAGATTTGRTLMPYLAVQVHAGLTADCTVLDIEKDTGNLLQTRPAIGGNILATIKTPSHRPQMATVRPHSTKPAEPDDGRTGSVERREAPTDLLTSRMKRIDFQPDTEQQGLQEADHVVTVGRGIKKADNIPLAQQLAHHLNAALGASRDVIDRGWLSYPHQIGLSGKTVTPRLYVGLGVSGAIQHLAGMQTAETIVAINSDLDAQIFKVADFGIVGDLFEIVPAINEKMQHRRTSSS